ncbi:hypothetical protein BGZ60DRAFT_533097 [Tricladium varicosporioides]|nr:hypothetical protein BGZ60DRAFT_533097 [Hymenoscyphus varicosporioides]
MKFCVIAGSLLVALAAARDPDAQPTPKPAPGPAVKTPATTLVKTPKPTTAATCDKVTFKESWGTTTFIFSQPTTRGLTTPATYASIVAGICAAVAGGSGGALAPLCLGAGAELAGYAVKADECNNKHQCLKLVYYPLVTLGVPFCVGKEDGCCGI